MQPIPTVATISIEQRFLPACRQPPEKILFDESGRQRTQAAAYSSGRSWRNLLSDLRKRLSDLGKSYWLCPAFRGGPAVDGFQKWKTTNCLALWRIDPASGATDRMCIPFGLWSGLPIDASHGSSALITLIPTAAGLFFTSTKIYGQQGSRACRSVGPLQARKWRGAPRSCPAISIKQFHRRTGTGWPSYMVRIGRTRVYGKPGSWTVAALDVCTSD